MTHSARIRDWLRTQDGPRSVPEIILGIGAPHACPLTAQSVHRMFRSGILVREGRCRSYRFALGRELVVREPVPKDEYLRRAREANRKRHARKGGRSLEQYRAEQAKRHAEWLARQAAAKAQRKADREAERAQRQAEQEAARAAARAARPKAGRKARTSLVATPRPLDKPTKGFRFDRTAPHPSSAPIRVESVEDFIRRGGQVVRLEPGVCAEPLRIYHERKAA